MIHTPNDGCDEVEEYERVIDGHIEGELPNRDPRIFTCGLTVPIAQTDADSEALEIAGFCPACGSKGGHEI